MKVSSGAVLPKYVSAAACDAVGVVAEEHGVEVALEDLLLRHRLLEHAGVVDLQHLVAAVALEAGEEVVLDDLHRDRRGTLLWARRRRSSTAWRRTRLRTLMPSWPKNSLSSTRQERVDHLRRDVCVRDRLGVLEFVEPRSRCRSRRRRTCVAPALRTPAARPAVPRARSATTRRAAPPTTTVAVISKAPPATTSASRGMQPRDTHSARPRYWRPTRPWAAGHDGRCRSRVRSPSMSMSPFPDPTVPFRRPTQRGDRRADVGRARSADRVARLLGRHDARPLHRAVRAGAGVAGDPRRHHHTARRCARVRQRLQAPGRCSPRSWRRWTSCPTVASRSGSAPDG